MIFGFYLVFHQINDSSFISYVFHTYIHKYFTSFHKFEDKYFFSLNVANNKLQIITFNIASYLLHLLILNFKLHEK